MKKRSPSSRPAVADVRSRITEVRRVRAGDLEPHPGNWRDHPDAQAQAMAGVMREVGDVGVLLAWRSERNGGKLTLIDGHLRRGIAPDHEYMVAVTDLSDAEADYVLATHDPLSAMASADAAALDALLSSVSSADAAVREMLSDLAMRSGIAAIGGDADAEPQIDAAEELRAKWGVERGQLWRLGEHRLLCGDSTNAEDVARVMAGKFRMVVTSPPYSNQREYEVGEIDWLALANGFFDAAIPATDLNCDILVNLGLVHSDGAVDAYWDAWLQHCKSAGWPLYGWYVWDKGNGAPGEWNGRLAPAHEFIFHFNSGRKPANKVVEAKGAARAGGASFRQKDGRLKRATSPDKIGQPFKVPDSVIRIGSEKTRGIHTRAAAPSRSRPATWPSRYSAGLTRPARRRS